MVDATGSVHGTLRIAVTGGSGFIGSHVVDALVAAGHRVSVLDGRPPHRADVAHVRSDIDDLDAMCRALAEHDVVYHLAAVSNVNDAYDQPVDTVRLNVLGTANVWEAARRNGLQRAVLASTVWVYAGARGDGPFDEDTPFHLPSAGHVYTSSKIASELIVHNYWEMYQQPFTILRYGIPYGPRMRKELVIPKFVDMAMEGRPITVNGDGSAYRNYVYITDLADAHVRVLAPVAENQVFNLEGLEQVSIKYLAESIRDAVGGAATVVHVPARVGDYAGTEVSADRALRVLGWQASTPFAEGMRRYVQWHIDTRTSSANGERGA